jgi:hypothetical protein
MKMAETAREPVLVDLALQGAAPTAHSPGKVRLRKGPGRYQGESLRHAGFYGTAAQSR